jgi:hypothetical protein
MMETIEHEHIQVRAYYLWQHRISDEVPGDAVSDWTEAEKEQKLIDCGPSAATVSFARDILPMFRPIDVRCMTSRGVLLDNYEWMSDPTGDYVNAKSQLAVLTNQSMPPRGPFWSPAQLDLLAKWISDGCPA